MIPNSLRPVRVAIVGALLLLAGCVTYQSHPLPTAPHWAATPTDAHGKPLATLDMRQASALALRADPDYQASLIDARISTLQLHAAGLLPDPQLSASVDHPTTPGYSHGWSLGLSEDVSWLLTRGATVDAARARRATTELQLAWQGWSLAQASAAGFVDLWTAQKRCALLQRQLDAATRFNAAYQRALARHDVTLDTASASLIDLTDTQSQLAAAEQAREAAQANLNHLLGVAPGARYGLVAPMPLTLPSASQLTAALQALPKTRPDLLALAAAAHATDADFRAAVMAQFPGLSVGVNRAGDTSRVDTTGFSINLNLPVFGRAQANARIARAARDRAVAEYQARLDQADVEARTLYAQLRQVAHQRKVLQQNLPQLRMFARRADRAFHAGNYSGAAWLAVQQSVITHELQMLDLTATLTKGEVALAALLGHVPPGASPIPAHGTLSR
ncbi:TolC family protein [Dyella sp. A6]|uniref:TolC family protein n=1 Tax=Dyella aluminiiresistens TaxID=3069105 RepID=UPI002E76822C|nr:TolC family protein [Dyella sp. A6]